MKRAKDNSGTGYSYGTPVSNSPNKNSQIYSNTLRCTCRDKVIVTPKDDVYKMHILRTTAINNDNDDVSEEVVS